MIKSSSQFICIFLKNRLVIFDIRDHLVDVDECVHTFAQVSEFKLRNVRHQLVAFFLFFFFFERVILIQKKVVFILQTSRVFLKNLTNGFVVLVCVIYPVLHLFLLNNLIRFCVLRRWSELWWLLRHRCSIIFLLRGSK